MDGGITARCYEGQVQRAEVKAMERDFVDALFSSLRERMPVLSSGVVILVGGGAALLRRQIEASGRVGTARFVEDVRVNARGYAYLHQMETTGG